MCSPLCTPPVCIAGPLVDSTTLPDEALYFLREADAYATKLAERVAEAHHTQVLKGC